MIMLPRTEFEMSENIRDFTGAYLFAFTYMPGFFRKMGVKALRSHPVLGAYVEPESSFIQLPQLKSGKVTPVH